MTVDPFDRMAAHARDELRGVPPDDGVVLLERRRHAQVRSRASIVGGAVALVVIIAVAARATDAGGGGALTVVASTAISQPAPVSLAPRSPDAASTIAPVDTLTIVDTGRRAAEPATGGPARDEVTVALAALLTPERLGAGWTALPALAAALPTDLWRFAASVPACAVGVASRDSKRPVSLFDATRRSAVFNNLQSQPFAQSVYVFATTDAATSAMDLLATPGWQSCWLALTDAEGPLADPYVSSMTSRGLAIPPPAPHGERQISYGRDLSYGSPDGRRVVGVRVAVFVQIGRAIVQVDPIPDTADSASPDGQVERVVAAATEALRAAV